ncbi:hypothetical protein AW736_26250 [Termitidicoccus mucosus]|uniref:Phosphoribosyltransferase domain-containing protein n=1 Tax=Termitidicoccus mucosus TaxID=1184151 RepID=A0A178IPQ1_9BACT|nr:hypothetical protein AW736_26250 [Opitutaceae bacterium TSB47]
MPDLRTPWSDFPDVLPHTSIASLKAHPAYADAKAGDFNAARAVAHALVNPTRFKWRTDFVVPVIKLDRDSVWNALPLGMADAISTFSGAKVVTTVFQSNIVHQSDANAVSRIVNQPLFEGKCPKGSYLIVDDIVSFGSTIANLRGFIESHGGKVAAASTFAAQIFATKLRPDSFTISSILRRFPHADDIIQSTTGGVSAATLTNREANFINGLSQIESIRNPLIPTHRVIKNSI